MRWLFADQLGPHFLDDPSERVLLIEARQAFARRRVHRQKAHLVLSALRHRAAELGEQAELRQVEHYREGLAGATALSVCEPTSRAAQRLVVRSGAEVVRHPGWVRSRQEFATWASPRRRLLLEDFYRDQRRHTGILMEGSAPVGGVWNLDHDNRLPPPKGAATLDVPAPPWPVEDEIDAEVRRDLDAWEAAGQVRFVGRDGPRRFAATRAEALRTLEHFVAHRLTAFGPFEDAMLAADPVLAHSTLSPALNLGLLDPVEVAQAAEAAYRAGRAPLNSVEGFVRQILGWREYVWHVYWYTDADYPRRNALDHHTPLPQWFAELDADAVQARCLRTVLEQVRDWGWTHHIPRLMILGSWALQRGYDPQALAAWFATRFVDGYDWVMTANVVGMSQHADGGFMATKPYSSGGAYIDRMSDFCGGCRYRPGSRLGPQACPFTAGYWAFLDRAGDALIANPRMRRPLAGRDRLADLAAVVSQERDRADAPP